MREPYGYFCLGSWDGGQCTTGDKDPRPRPSSRVARRLSEPSLTAHAGEGHDGLPQETSVAKFRKYGGKVNITEKIYTSSKNRHGDGDGPLDGVIAFKSLAK